MAKVELAVQRFEADAEQETFFKRGRDGQMKAFVRRQMPKRLNVDVTGDTKPLGMPSDAGADIEAELIAALDAESKKARSQTPCRDMSNMFHAALNNNTCSDPP